MMNIHMQLPLLTLTYVIIISERCVCFILFIKENDMHVLHIYALQIYLEWFHLNFLKGHFTPYETSSCSRLISAVGAAHTASLVVVAPAGPTLRAPRETWPLSKSQSRLSTSE